MNFLKHMPTRGALLVLGIGVLAISQSATGDAQSATVLAQGGPSTDRDYHHDTSPRLDQIPPKPYVGKTER